MYHSEFKMNEKEKKEKMHCRVRLPGQEQFRDCRRETNVCAGQHNPTRLEINHDLN